MSEQENGSVGYLYLEVNATVDNKTQWDMILKTSHIEWGKFDEGKSPIDVSALSKGEFVARGRDSSPSGTEGYAKWIIKNHPQNPVITASFCNPAVGKCSASITCEPIDAVSVKCEGKSANKFNVTYTIG